MLGFSCVQAQTTYIPGIIAGLNASTISTLEADYKADFYVGFFVAIKCNDFYTFQPEFNYSRQGAKKVHIEVYDTPIIKGDMKELRLKTIIENVDIQYLGINFNNKFQFEKFNLQTGLDFDLAINSSKNANNSFDVSFNFGLGYDITDNLGVEFRFKRGINAVVNSGFFNTSAGENTNNVFQIGAYYQFKSMK